MRRFAALTLAILAATATAAPRFAYSSVPISALADGQNIPTLAPVIKKVAASVVSIAIRVPAGQQPNSLFDEPILRQLFGLPDMPSQNETFAAGSGVVIDANKGYIVTNYHVVENADRIAVTFLNGNQVNGVLVGSDPDTDVAVVKVPPANITAIPFGDSDRLEVGDFVLAIGNPFGIGQTVTSGIVSALKRTSMGLEGYEDFIQTDASINPGNSGGALVNLRGELVGINAAIVGVNGGNVGIGFAIPINMVRAIADQLVKYGAVARGELGIAMAGLTPDLAARWRLAPSQSGVVITRVDPKSAAERAGLKPGDLVAALDGTPVSDAPDLRNKIGMLRVGDTAELTVLRDGRPVRLNATLTAPTPKLLEGGELSPLFQGALFTTTPMGARDKGVQVATVKGGSKAWTSGLREGDTITSVNMKRTIGIDEFAGEVGKTPNRLLLDLVRGGQPLFLSIRMNDTAPRKGATR
jgi:serine protease Do/serine protease DegQ